MDAYSEYFINVVGFDVGEETGDAMSDVFLFFY
jgi:hypothetical protein